MHVILRQNDPKWGGKPLGHSLDRHIGGYGCALTELAQVQNEFYPESPLTPDVAQAKILAANPLAFTFASISFELAAPALGLIALEKERIRGRVGDASLAPHIRAGLRAGALVIVQVDSDDAAHGYDADDTGKHFVTVRVEIDGNFVCFDPAPAKPIQLDVDTLMGESMWGAQKKLYRVVSALWVRKAAP